MHGAGSTEIAILTLGAASRAHACALERALLKPHLYRCRTFVRRHGGVPESLAHDPVPYLAILSREVPDEETQPPALLIASVVTKRECRLRPGYDRSRMNTGPTMEVSFI